MTQYWVQLDFTQDTSSEQVNSSPLEFLGAPLGNDNTDTPSEGSVTTTETALNPGQTGGSQQASLPVFSGPNSNIYSKVAFGSASTTNGAAPDFSGKISDFFGWLASHHLGHGVEAQPS
jgi:hypothetical protein